jgi:DNA-binding transcriptional ArsR family regulator
MPSEEPATPERGPQPREIRKLTDARTLRALAHPIRIALLELLLLEGAQTATEAAEQIGETPTTCSFHLRQLARYGFVEEAGGGRGRARPWRLTGIGMSFDPASGDREAEVASEATVRLFRERQLGRYDTWLATRGAYPPAWRKAASDSEYLFYLTPDELEQMNAEVHTLLERWFEREGRIEDPARRPPGSAPVEMLMFNFPIAAPKKAAPDTTAGSDG